MLSGFIDNIFLQMALFASLLASIASGVIGSFVVIKRISFITGSIAHAIIGGMGFCLWLQKSVHLTFINPIWGAFFSAIGFALILGWVHLNYREREDTVIAAIWSMGMAIGIIFFSITPGANVALIEYLFGNILWIDSQDLLLLGILNTFILLIVSLYYKKFLALCFDEEQAFLQNVAVKKLYLLLLCLVAISIVILMQIIGTILVIAMLTIPASIASLLTHRLSMMIVTAVFLSAFLNIFGLFSAFHLNWPPAATISLLTALSYFFCLILKKKKNFSLQRK